LAELVAGGLELSRRLGNLVLMGPPLDLVQVSEGRDVWLLPPLPGLLVVLWSRVPGVPTPGYRRPALPGLRHVTADVRDVPGATAVVIGRRGPLSPLPGLLAFRGLPYQGLPPLGGGCGSCILQPR
jgi:hypothetical protein